jgi:hypothetical protein
MGEVITSFPAGIRRFLASADSDYMSGQIILCDGAMVLV